MNQLNYHHLFYFYTTAKEGSIAKASTILHLTPQTISSQIAALEDAFGFKLFDRVGKKLILNDRGKLAFSFAEDIFNLGNELKQNFINQYQTTQRVFTVGLTDALPKVLAFDLFRYCFDEDCIEENKSTRLICKEGDLPSLMAELAINKLDVILSDQPIQPTSNLKAYNHVIGDSSISFFAKPSLVSSLRGSFPQSLHHQPFLMAGDRSVLRINLLSWFESQGIQPIIRGEFADSALTKLFGQAGYGIFCAPTSIEQHLVEQYGLSIVGRTSDIKETLYLISPERKLQHPAVVPLFKHAKSVINDPE